MHAVCQRLQLQNLAVPEKGHAMSVPVIEDVSAELV